MKNTIKRTLLTISTSLMLFLSGCAGSSGIAPQATIASTATKTAASTPTLASSPTPQPTFSWDETNQYWTEMGKTNGNCAEMPCWWGFDLNDLTWEAVRSTFEIYDVEILENNYRILDDINHQIQFDDQFVSFLENPNGYVDLIYYLKQESMAGILQEYGMPEEVLIFVYTNMTDYPDVFVTLIYLEDGLIIHAVNRAHIEILAQDRQIVLCGSDFGEEFLIDIWPNRAENAAEYSLGYVKALDKTTGFTFYPIEDVTNMNPQEFYSAFSQPDSNLCLRSPASHW